MTLVHSRLCEITLLSSGTVIQSAAITYRAGAAAPGDVLLHLVQIQNHHFFGLVQPVGLVDYESLKKSI